MLTALLMGGLAHAGGMIGTEYVPAGLTDMAWVESDQLSGSMVAERDGMLVPPLTAVGGYAWDRIGIFGGFSVARVSTTIITTDSEARSTRMAIRPSAEVRYWFNDVGAERPLFFANVGAHWVIPSTTETAGQASEADQAALDEAAKEAAGRIGAIGGNIGVGAEVRWENGMGLGIRTDIVITRFDTSNAQTQTVSSLIRPRTAFTLSYWF